jgi:thiamine-phosphate pyrophosphorylase
MLPRLHLVTNDDVLADSSFAAHAESIVRQLGGTVAVHLRGRATSARRLFDLAARLNSWPDAVVFINERVDIALAANSAGVHLPVGALPVEAARALLGPDRWIGCSVHQESEAHQAEADGADFVMAGSIYPSASHPLARAQGIGFLQNLSAHVRLPIVAIGGVDRHRVQECSRAGAYGVAVVRAVWAAAEPLPAARALLEQLEQQPSST